MVDTCETLNDVDAIIRALGGVRAVMELTGAKTPQVVNNWRSLNRFASHTYLVITAALAAKGLNAPPGLWGITEPCDVLAKRAS